MQGLAGRPSRANQAGFTIVELVTVMVLFVILVPTLALAINSLYTVNYQSQAVRAVNTTVEAQVELLRARPFAELTPGTTDFTSKLPSLIHEPRSAHYTISQVSGNAALKQVDVEVSYDDGSEVYSYRTYINGVAP